MYRLDVWEKINERKARSAWERGVRQYALELLLNSLESPIIVPDNLEKQLLNGAQNWKEFSYGGNALIYDFEIALRLCTKGEWEKCKFATKRPNRNESWLDVQARALFQSYLKIQLAVDQLNK